MIKISGFSKQQTKVRKATERVANALGIDVDITVRKLKQTSPDKYGFAYEVMNTHGLCIFNDCPDDQLPVVISHELVHIHQTIRGDLKFNPEAMTFWWKGEKYDADRLATIEYYDRPWEAEAKQLEKELAENFFMS